MPVSQTARQFHPAADLFKYWLAEAVLQLVQFVETMSHVLQTALQLEQLNMATSSKNPSGQAVRHCPAATK